MRILGCGQDALLGGVALHEPFTMVPVEVWPQALGAEVQGAGQLLLDGGGALQDCVWVAAIIWQSPVTAPFLSRGATREPFLSRPQVPL